jgi:hypothetical protein
MTPSEPDTPVAAATDGGRARRPPRWVLAVAMTALLVLAAVITGPPATDEPLDPDSVAPEGLRGLRDLLEAVGVQTDVSLDLPVDMSTKLFVPLDRLGERRHEAIAAWVRDGGTLVVADPTSRLHGLGSSPPGFEGVLGATPRRPACALDAVEEVDEVVHAGWSGLTVPDGATGCFPVGDEAAWLVARPEGAGTIVALGSAAPFTNRDLDRADNAVLAASLLGAAPGDRVVFVPLPPLGEGDATLLDLVAPRVWRGLGVLLVASLLGVLWRSRRLGPPVPERLPPVVPAAELARSVAGLLQRAHSRQGAAAQLRVHARREVGARLGAPGSASGEELAQLAVARTEVAPDVARTALVDGPVDDDGGLVEVARAAGTLRRALAGRAIGGGPHGDGGP